MVARRCSTADLPPDWERRKAERVRKNEAAFKAHNERRKAFEEGSVGAEEPIPFACECGDAHCHDPVELTIGQFDGGHARDRWYIVKPHHVMPEYEFVIARHPSHWVVEKYTPDKAPEAGAMRRIMSRLRRSRTQVPSSAITS
jgi:hypothetical protein